MDTRSCCSAREETPDAYARRHGRRFVSELADLVRFPSVSSDIAHAADMRDCAAWLAGQLRRIGLDGVRVCDTGGHPVVYGHWLQAPRRPTVLIYGHYDVQPSDPAREWSSPPFEPVVRDDRLFGRGAADDKGQMFVHLKAIESWLCTRAALPVNVKCLLEGEEEIGSTHLSAFLGAHRQDLVADAAVVSDMRIRGPDAPSLTESVRGALSLELNVCGARTDLHSGNFGGAVYNPVQALCAIIARLQDAQGRVVIPGFYNRVREVPAHERREMAAAGPSDRDVLADAGTRWTWGEPGFTAYERTTIRPVLTVTTVRSGHQGPGVKAVIPSRASAMLDFRLVDDQDPAEIDRLCRRFVGGIVPPQVTVTLRTLFSAPPASTPRNSIAMRSAAAAYRTGFGRAPTFLRIGGTIPVVHMLQRLLKVPTVMMGFALPDSNLHAPDENLHLPTFFRGIRTSIQFLREMAQRGAS
jgi:acetylornithine deacetylase/succinyl-diaminopimelate desuccinylase-like protein